MRPRNPFLAVALLWPLAASAAQSVGDGYFVFHGVTHTHTGMTDGVAGTTPATAYEYARSRGLDWLMVTPHNHTCAGLAAGEYQQAYQQAAGATVDGSFVAILGMEWGVSKGGHIILFEPPATIGWGGDPAGCGGSFYDVYVEKPNYAGPEGLYQAMYENQNAWGPIIGSFAHPHDNEFNNYSMGVYGKDVMRFVELIKGNGGWRQEDESQRGVILEARYQWLLSRGWRVGAVQSHDSHGHNWGSATADRTGVIARSLVKAELMGALYARHTFVTQDKDSWLLLRADGKLMGEELSPSAPVAMSVRTGDGGGEAYVSTTLYGGRVVADEPVSVIAQSAGGALDVVVPVPEVDSYYYAVAQQADGDKLFSSPIWLLAVPSTGTPATPTPAPPTPTPKPGTPTPTPPPTAAGVVLNEYLPRPVSDWDGNGTPDFTDEWIEIYNAGTSAVELSGLSIGDPVKTWPLPAGTLKPGCFRVYFRSQTGIALNSGSDTVYLKSASGQILDQHSYSSDAPDQSYGRAVDGSGGWTTFASPTMGASNHGAGSCSP
jgi:hypothetical protein